MAGSSAYTAAKGSLRTLTKAAAVECAKQSIRINSVHPGNIATPVVEPSMKDAMPFYRIFTQLPYMGKPEDVAYGVQFQVYMRTRRTDPVLLVFYCR